MNSTKEEIDQIDWENVDSKIKELSFKGEEKLAKCVSVYDGDTVRVVFPIYKTLYKWNCRLNRIDTPELRTNNVLEQSFGYEVRDLIRERIQGKMVTVKCDDFDKYGRLLAEIYLDGESINQWLIDNKYAFEYDGGTKKFWEPYLTEKGYIAVPKKVPEKVKKVKKEKVEKKKAENNKENGETPVKENQEIGKKNENGEELLGKKKGRSRKVTEKVEKVEKVEKKKRGKVEEKVLEKVQKKVEKKKKHNHKGRKRDSESSSCDEDFEYNSSEASYDYE